MTKRRTRVLRLVALAAPFGMLFQQGCAIDPDLFLQAAVQFFTEAAIFISDNALVSLL